MKKTLIFSAALVLSLGLVGCGTDSAKEDKPKEETAVSTEEKTDTSKEEKKDADKKEDNEYEDKDIKGMDTYSEELNISGQSGPLKYNIEEVVLKKLTPKTEEAADLFSVSVGEEVNLITIFMNGENTSTEDMSFYLGQATIITNTKEQLEPDMILSEHIEGDYLGQVKQEGYNVYVLKNSKVEDLKNIEIRIDAPINSKMDNQGENIIQKFEVNKK
ncbi:hypothetical protein FCT18_14860 [Lysinibacillus sphaericus]|uniref:Prophage pi3 protein 59 n=1 Tax=Lysinibacillus sphaericus TaxID=1421 RepID=A0A2S0K6D0_LYSSH|nr:hypothetical protein [Lysinibacillus sphaericus]AVK98824.1 hypothetical protein LS41612_22305 [Lysinibacillus sphaericus]MED4545317.1 hypothetical protein [Lysinibacillus sphaericus]TKI18374.1 hypothetical protein FCT18_14860 [Lysinibacillus sphaericus]SUV15162.1 prophage pi3 protein 59 [Lysinibacillus sphaericus]GEC84612.1 hypothetical protein LSP03_43550 [Lysinibacillus sphaericus]